MSADFVTTGAAQYIDCGTSERMRENAPLTISSWIYPRTTGDSGSGRIVQRRNATAATFGVSLNMFGTASIQFGIDGGSKFEVNGVSNSIVLNTWQHVLVSWDGTMVSANVNIYVGGTEISYALKQNGSTPGVTTGQPTTVGDRANLDRSFNGMIAELAVWNIQLSAGEISALAKGFKPNKVRLAGINLYLPFVRNVYSVVVNAVTNNGSSPADHPRIYG